MVSKKNKRKIIFNDSVFYWYVRIDDGCHRVHIISDDKKIHLICPFVDTEMLVTPLSVRSYLEEYFNNI
ncbi:MAG: hypothetical protein NC489_00875 [Ruminococcus flavefaciens]|nr:hypothetical protein [Ruminococcus flavefaciens]